MRRLDAAKVGPSLVARKLRSIRQFWYGYRVFDELFGLMKTVVAKQHFRCNAGALDAELTKYDGARVRVDDREKEWAVLMRAGIAGDAAAYRRLLGQLTPALRAFAGRGLARAGVSATDAEDVVQETLLARHKLIDSLRRRGRRIEISIDDFAEILPSGDDGRSSVVADISRHLDGLPAGQRNVVHCIVGSPGTELEFAL